MSPMRGFHAVDENFLQNKNVSVTPSAVCKTLSCHTSDLNLWQTLLLNSHEPTHAHLTFMVTPFASAIKLKLHLQRC